LYFTLKRLCAKGGVEMPINEIAELVPSVKNDMAIGSALYQLERAGFITRAYQHGSRTYTTQLTEPVRELDDLEIDFERLDAKFQRDAGKLQKMIDYADSHGCRHHYILSYFGDADASPHCTVCDNCLSKSSAAVRLPTEEETIIIQKALSCVARVNGRFGRARIAQTLVGSNSKDVVDARLDQLSTYGLLAEQGADYVWSLIDALIRNGCLHLSSGQYPTLSLTDAGRDVMLRKTVLPLAIPEATASRPKAKRTEKKSKTVKVDTADYDPNVFEALREWRRETSTRLGAPAYLVFPDKTLEELARVLPESPSDLLNVRGIGPAKAQRFGADALAVIAKTRPR
jgi:ATP-dependent DNA helicase RecQ